MKSPFYNTYFFRYSQNTTYNMIEKKLQGLGPEVQISVHNISDSSKAEQMQTIYRIFTAERMRMYERDKQKECYVHIIRITEKVYIAIISVYPFGRFGENESVVLSTLCKPIATYMASNTGANECEKYWKKYIKEFVYAGIYDYENKYIFDGEEFLPIDIEKINELKEMFRDNPLQAKALLTCAFARVALAGVRRDSIIIEDHICYGRLTRMPIRVCNLTSAIPVNDAVGDFSNALRYSNISYDEICEISKTHLENHTLYSQTVIYDKIFENIFKNSELERLYKFDAISHADTPLFLVFRMDGDMASIQYLYDKSYFKDFEMDGLHNAFCVTLSKLMSSDYTETDYSKYLIKSDSSEDKRTKAIVSCLKKSGWFDEYSENELIKLAQKSKVKRLFREQNFIDSGTVEDSVYLLVKGKLEVIGRDSANVLHSLSLIKEMNFFDLKSISEKPTASEDYQVITEDALAVVIDKDTFLEEASNHNELYIKSISQLCATAAKYQKLWMMS